MRKKKERKIFKKDDWQKLFPEAVHQADILAKIRPKVERNIKVQQSEQLIGENRERKVVAALNDLKKKGEIRDYFKSEKLSYADLIQGIDFIFIYVDDVYRVCSFSVTGKNWVGKHLEKHPEIPVVEVRLNETRESIQKKIMGLKERF